MAAGPIHNEITDLGAKLPDLPLIRIREAVRLLRAAGEIRARREEAVHNDGKIPPAGEYGLSPTEYAAAELLNALQEENETLRAALARAGEPSS